MFSAKLESWSRGTEGSIMSWNVSLSLKRSKLSYFCHPAAWQNTLSLFSFQWLAYCRRKKYTHKYTQHTIADEQIFSKAENRITLTRIMHKILHGSCVRWINTHDNEVTYLAISRSIYWEIYTWIELININAK